MPHNIPHDIKATIIVTGCKSNAWPNILGSIIFPIITWTKTGKTITKIIETDITNIDIVGVLVLRSNHKYGFNKRKFPIYLFKPFDFRYPDFLVASGVDWVKHVDVRVDDTSHIHSSSDDEPIVDDLLV